MNRYAKRYVMFVACYILYAELFAYGALNWQVDQFIQINAVILLVVGGVMSFIGLIYGASEGFYDW